MTPERTLSNAVGVLLSVSDARLGQWKGVARGERPDSLVDELWEATPEEAQRLADMIQDAMAMVQRANMDQPGEVWQEKDCE